MQNWLAGMKRRQTMVKKNGWMLDVLASLPYRSEFTDGMRQSLKEQPLLTLPEKAIESLRDIYARQFGRLGTGKYRIAVARFNRLAGLWDD